MRRELLGYNRDQVDSFLARCLATPGVYRSRYPQLRARTPDGERVTADEISDVRFAMSLIGYRIREVDSLLEDLYEAVERTTWAAPEIDLTTASLTRSVALQESERVRSR
jgi:DivIVA domain-containing protein